MQMTWDYVAGFFDGEGSLVFPNAKNRPRSYPPVLSISQVDRRPLDGLRDFIGDGKVELREQSRTAHGHRPIHVYTLSRVATLRRVLPELARRCIVKRDVVLRGINDLEGRRTVMPKRMVAAITPDDVRMALREHCTRRAAALALGFRSQVSLYKIMRENGIEWPKHKGGRRRKTLSAMPPVEPTADEIRMALQAHKTIHAASVALGIPDSRCLQYRMRKHGIEWPKMNVGLRARQLTLAARSGAS